MSTISVTNINDGDAVTAASINNQVNTIVNDYNGGITNANLNASAAIGAEKLAGGISGMFGAWGSWTPTLTNWALGNGTMVGKYQQVGKTVHARLSVVFGSSTTVSGDVTYSLPVTAAVYAGTSNVTPIGWGQFFDTSASRVYEGVALMASTTTGTLRNTPADTTYLYNLANSSTTPFTAAFATGDEIALYIIFEAA